MEKAMFQGSKYSLDTQPVNERLDCLGKESDEFEAGLAALKASFREGIGRLNKEADALTAGLAELRARWDARMSALEARLDLYEAGLAPTQVAAE
jgi:hypothetical protein